MTPLKAMAAAAANFIRAANAMVNAQTRLMKYEQGSRGHAKAMEALTGVNAIYDVALAELELKIEEAK
jgi:hypothetical protein